MAMNLSAASATAWAGGPRSAARSMKVARSISRVSSWPSNSANFTPFEAAAVSNMVVLPALGSRTKLVERSHHAAADESIAGWYWSILRDRTSCYLVLSSTAPMHPPQRTGLYWHRIEQRSRHNVCARQQHRAARVMIV